jgi:hypothetical protein
LRWLGYDFGSDVLGVSERHPSLDRVMALKELGQGAPALLWIRCFAQAQIFEAV